MYKGSRVGGIGRCVRPLGCAWQCPGDGGRWGWNPLLASDEFVGGPYSADGKPGAWHRVTVGTGTGPPPPPRWTFPGKKPRVWSRSRGLQGPLLCCLGFQSTQLCLKTIRQRPPHPEPPHPGPRWAAVSRGLRQDSWLLGERPVLSGSRPGWARSGVVLGCCDALKGRLGPLGPFSCPRLPSGVKPMGCRA